MSSEATKRLRSWLPIAIVAGTMVLVGTAILLIAPRDDPDRKSDADSSPLAPTAAPTEPAPPPGHTPTEVASAPAPPAEPSATPSDDPFEQPMFEEPAPEIVNAARARHEAGKRLHGKMRLGLYEYGERHGTDARPQLILAYDEIRLGWWRAAHGHYESALSADPRTKENPKVLDDLLLLMRRGESERASATIARHYGKAALPRIVELQAELAERDDGAAVERLDALKAQIE